MYPRFLPQLEKIHETSPSPRDQARFPCIACRAIASRGSSQLRNRPGVSCVAGGFFTSWASRKALMSVRKAWRTLSPQLRRSLPHTPGPEELGVVRGCLTSVSLASGEVSPPRSAGAPRFEKCDLKQFTGSLRPTGVPPPWTLPGKPSLPWGGGSSQHRSFMRKPVFYLYLASASPFSVNPKQVRASSSVRPARKTESRFSPQRKDVLWGATSTAPPCSDSPSRRSADADQRSGGLEWSGPGEA